MTVIFEIWIAKKNNLQTDFFVKLRNFLLFVPRSARFVIFSEIATQPLNVQFFRQIIVFKKSHKYWTFDKKKSLHSIRDVLDLPAQRQNHGRYFNHV